MKKKFLFTFSLFLFFIASNSRLSAECGLNDPIISNINCIENASYEFDVNFAISDPSLDSFNIYVNDILYGKFSIFELPVRVVQNNFSGKKFDKLKISDPDIENCYVIKEIENPCGCAIFNFKYAKTKCTDTTFNIVLDFRHFETSDSFDIGMIGKFFGTYSYNKLPITIGPFKSKDTTYILNVVDRGDFFCFTDFSFKAGQCPDCSISDIKLLGFECNADNLIYVKLAFNHTNVKNNKFVVKTNFSDDKFFEYRKNIIVDSVTFREEFVLGPLDVNCEKPFIVAIWDIENQGCGSTATFDTICCDEKCAIGEIFIKEPLCMPDSTYQFYLKFTFENNTSKVFTVNVNNQFNGVFNTDQLPVLIKGVKLDGSKNDFVTICMDEGECCKTREYAVPECNVEECIIDSITWKPIFDTTAGKYWIKIDFNYQHTSESFIVKGNGINYGVFNYASLPVILGSYKCSDNKNLEFLILDSKNALCKNLIEPGIIICPTSSAYELNSDSDWHIYKNINENCIDIVSESEITKNAVVEIFNTVGRKVTAIKAEDGLNEFKAMLPETPAGIYIVRFKNSDSIYTRKVLLGRG